MTEKPVMFGKSLAIRTRDLVNAQGVTGQAPSIARDAPHSPVRLAQAIEDIAADGIGDCTMVGHDVTVSVYNRGGAVATDDYVYLARVAGDEISEDDGDTPALRGQWEIISGSGCGCPEIHEFKTEGSPTGSSCSVTYTVNGVTGSAATLAYNSSASSFKTALLASNAEFTSTNLNVTDGPWPLVAIYVEFLDDLAGQAIDLPAFTSSLTGTNAIGKLSRLSRAG